MPDPIRERLNEMSVHIDKRAQMAKMRPGGQVVWWTDEEQMHTALRAVLDLCDDAPRLHGRMIDAWEIEATIAEHLGVEL